MTAELGARDAIHVLEASALLRLDLADVPMPPTLEAVMERGCRGEGVLLIPDLFWLEMTSVIGKQITRKLLSDKEARALLEELQRLPLRTMATADLCQSALKLAQQQGLSVDDAIDLALARRHGAVLRTADDRLGAAARRCGCAPPESA